MENGIKIELNVGDALEDFLDQIVITRLKQAIDCCEHKSDKKKLEFVLEYFGGDYDQRLFGLRRTD